MALKSGEEYHRRGEQILAAIDECDRERDRIRGMPEGGGDLRFSKNCFIHLQSWVQNPTQKRMTRLQTKRGFPTSSEEGGLQ